MIEVCAIPITNCKLLQFARSLINKQQQNNNDNNTYTTIIPADTLNF